MSTSELFRAELNGAPVQSEDLKILWPSSYGHFTVLPVHNARVRGLALHLDRLQQNTQILYGCELNRSRVLAYVRHAIEGISATTPLAVRVDVTSRIAATDPTQRIVAPDIVVTVRAAPDESTTPLRVRSTQYERDLPQVKHAGTFGLIYTFRAAQLNGFDDALFTDVSGRISEGTGWNVGFFDGRNVIWPSAPVLPGIAMRLIQAGLEKRHIPSETREVRLQDLSAFHSAFLTSVLVGAQPIASIDEVSFSPDADLFALLKDCYEGIAEEAL